MEAVLPGLHERFSGAQPFRHVVIDDFLPPEDARAIAAAFPEPRGSDRVLATLFAARTYSSDRSEIQPQLAQLFDKLASPAFIAWLEELSGIRNLQIDPDFVGAGLHQAVNGSNLPVHADHNTHPENDALYRRLNVLVYMNPIWKPEWGGVLELWDPNAASPAVTIAPILNRCIVMEVHDRAFHGYRRLRVPAGTARNAIAAYYYAPEPAPQQAALPHATVFPAAGQSPRQLLLRRLRHAALLQILKARRRFARPRSASDGKR